MGLGGFVVEATLFTVIAILIYMVSASPASATSRRAGSAARNLFLHVVVPVIGVICAFILPLYTQYFNLAALFDGDLFGWAYKDEAAANVYFDKAFPATWSIMGARPG